MKKVSFKSGVHPFEGKEFSEDKNIKKIEASSVLVFPMSQHIGAPAKPIVSVGDRVLKGMKIGEQNGFISSSVYSSVSGTVKAIENRRTIQGAEVLSVVVENDGLYECDEDFEKIKDPNEYSREDIVKIITDAGIVGMGGAGFPTGVKLSPKDANDIDYIIINGSECEPYLTSDYRLMVEESGNILTGISIVLRLFKNAKAIIAIEDNKPLAIKTLEEQSNGLKNITVQKLQTRYPQGGERRLIASVTGRKINSGMLPADAGCIVMNIATVFAVYEAVCNNMPLIHRVMTITGDGVNEPANVDVPLGISYEYLIEQVGGLKENTVKVISGGPMMGTSLPSLDFPIIKTSSSVLAITKDDIDKMNTTPCIHCGRCVKACPEHLVPQLLAKAAVDSNYESFDTLGGMECIECGCCTYVCPAKRPLTQAFKVAKAELRAAAKRKN